MNKIEKIFLIKGNDWSLSVSSLEIKEGYVFVSCWGNFYFMETDIEKIEELDNRKEITLKEGVGLNPCGIR